MGGDSFPITHFFCNESSLNLKEMKEDKKEMMKQKAYSGLDWFLAAVLLGLFFTIVIVSINGFSKLVKKVFPSLINDTKNDKSS